MNNKKDDSNAYEKYCMLCGRSESAAGKIIDIPGGIRVCPDCIQRAFNSMQTAGLSQADWQRMMEEFSKIAPPGGSANGSSVGGRASGTDKESEKSGSEDGSQKLTSREKPGISRKKHQAETSDTHSGADSGKDALSVEENTPHPVSDGDADEVMDADVVSVEDEENEKTSNSGNHKNFRIPSISMINLGDLFGNFGMPRQQQQVKKKPKEKQPVKELDIAHIPAPHKIKASLDEYVVGQDHAKKVISVAVYNHYKRIAAYEAKEKAKAEKAENASTADAQSPSQSRGGSSAAEDGRGADAGSILSNVDLSQRSSVYFDDIEIEKSNMLLLGPTGCGKTYLVKTLARLLDVPLAIADATSLTEAGYIGDDIESVVSRLLAAADNDVARAEQGIIFIDEIDKIARKKNTNQRDVSGEAVQQGMLKLLEGSEIEVPVGAASKNAMVPMATVDTSNILFICGGAFPGLEEIIKERLNKQASIGFFSDLKDKYDDDPDLLMKVEVDDLRAFGMIPEFLGRLPIICPLQSLTKEMLVRILKEPRNAIIRQYQKLLALDEVELTIDDDALEAIAEKAMKKKTGARALRAIIEEFMLDIMYEIPKDENIGSVEITRAYIEHTGGPIICMRGSQAALPQG